jgi:hypothetical protein
MSTKDFVICDDCGKQPITAEHRGKLCPQCWLLIDRYLAKCILDRAEELNEDKTLNLEDIAEGIPPEPGARCLICNASKNLDYVTPHNTGVIDAWDGHEIHDSRRICASCYHVLDCKDEYLNSGNQGDNTSV